ncbi:MAG: glycosyltransferase [Acidobacteriota bacterium]
MKVALVHDWLTGMRGGEKVLEVLCGLYPDAPVFTLLHVKGSVSRAIESHRIVTSFLQHLPLVGRRYRHYLPLFPAAISSLDLAGFDLVISSSHAVAKSAPAPAGALHVCYCFTPMRYVWDRHDDYFGPGRATLPTRLAARLVVPPLREWDRRTATRAHAYVAISRTIRDRIYRAYGLDSEVIEPPVDTDFFRPPAGERDKQPRPFLVVSALVPYKRVDLIVEAFRGLEQKLRIVGRGPDLDLLRRQAPANVAFLGEVGTDALLEEYQGCRALIHAAVEDFGIAPVEAMACGRPVIGLAQGALPETVTPGTTGILFPEQSVSAIRQAVSDLDKRGDISFNPQAIRESVLRFSTERFRERFASFVGDRLKLRTSA